MNNYNDRLKSEPMFDGFKVGVQLNDSWIVTKGVFITHDDKKYIIEKDVILSVKQVKNSYSYIYLDNKSTPPKPEFFHDLKEPEWSKKNKGWFCGKHRLIGLIPPVGLSFIEHRATEPILPQSNIFVDTFNNE